MIKRIFHPIGQGAFYSERHEEFNEKFNMVYDCGNWKNTKPADEVVKQAFIKGETIDVLFISHFDYDHVNKISTLKKHTQIKKVIMPLLHDNEKIFLINLYKGLDFSQILTLIENPQEFFGEETQIVTVRPSENNENPIGDDVEIIDLDNLKNTQIQSGSILRKKFKTYEWVFIPFNYEYENRNSELENLLLENGFCVKELKENPKYNIEKVIEGRKKLKDIYTKVSGNINENSMLLYSGISHLDKSYRQKASYFDCFYRCFKCDDEFYHISRWHRMARENHRVSCIYTGDSNLNTVNVKTIFKNFWSSVGTIQVPHHGDIKSFNESILNDGYYYCPISVGKTNTYGHPSYTLISNIISKGSCPILVTEDLNSVFIEYIYKMI